MLHFVSKNDSLHFYFLNLFKTKQFHLRNQPLFLYLFFFFSETLYILYLTLYSAKDRLLSSNLPSYVKTTATTSSHVNSQRIIISFILIFFSCQNFLSNSNTIFQSKYYHSLYLFSPLFFKVLALSNANLYTCSLAGFLGYFFLGF